MKRLLISVILCLVTVSIVPENIVKTISKEDASEVARIIEFSRISILEQEKLDRFLSRMGFLESTNNHEAVNKYGFIGEYQFGKAALSEIGYEVSVRDFKEDPSIFNKEMQRDAMIKYMKLNEQRMQKYIKRYNGRYINNIRITKSGILAACHLAGTGNVIEFLESNGEIEFSDGFNTPVTKYFKEFSQYKFNLNLIS